MGQLTVIGGCDSRLRQRRLDVSVIIQYSEWMSPPAPMKSYNGVEFNWMKSFKINSLKCVGKSWGFTMKVCKLVQELRDCCPAAVSLCLFPQDHLHVLGDSVFHSLCVLFCVQKTSREYVPGTPATGKRKRGVKRRKDTNDELLNLSVLHHTNIQLDYLCFIPGVSETLIRKWELCTVKKIQQQHFKIYRFIYSGEKKHISLTDIILIYQQSLLQTKNKLKNTNCKEKIRRKKKNIAGSSN